ncbi:hypothetical protein GCM10011498_03250 [Amylibacter cionae]|uniref:Uncharacterized protein n=1 Tax=Neptunicoccus cionae TaxID=2035344 RepID=A0A916QSY6_9RHOB|nr:hypothetical protein GCM10011498_03250 [Amylibacter cionae]
MLPSTLRGTEDAPLNVDLSGVQFSDPENDILALRLTASEGRIDLGAATSGVTVSQTGTATAALYGTAAALEAYLQTVNAVQYTGAQDVFGDAAATLTLTVSDGDAETIAGVISIDLADAVDSQTAVDGENHLIGGLGRTF